MTEPTFAELVAMNQAAVAKINAATAGFISFHTGSATGGPNGDGLYPFALADGSTALLPCMARLILDAGLAQAITLQVAADDELVTQGVALARIRLPWAGTLVGVRAALVTASGSGGLTLDVKRNGVSVLSSPLVVIAGARTSLAAGTPQPAFSATAMADDDEITVDVPGPGLNAEGLSVTLLMSPPA